MRHFVVVPHLDYSGPTWLGGSPAEQGYDVLPLPNLKRSNAKDNEYYVYSNVTEYKAIEADSVVSAIAASRIEDPYKVIHAHTKIDDVIDTKELEYIGKDSSYMEKHGIKSRSDSLSTNEQPTKSDNKIAIDISEQPKPTVENN